MRSCLVIAAIAALCLRPAAARAACDEDTPDSTRARRSERPGRSAPKPPAPTQEERDPAAPPQAGTGTPRPSPPPPKPAPRLTYGAFADFYFASNLNEPFTGGNAFRVPETADEHGPHLGFLTLWVEEAPEPVGFRIDLGFGNVARLISQFDPSNAREFWAHVPQAYVIAKLDKKGATQLEAGKWYMRQGVETAIPRLNWVYSTGLLHLFAVPIYSLGARVYHHYNQTDFAMVAVERGWNTIGDPDHAPGLWLSGGKALNKQVMLIGSYVGGDENDRFGRANWRHYVDLNLMVNPGGKWHYAFEGDYATQGDAQLAPGVRERAQWYGLSAWARRDLGRGQYAAARVDWYRDDSGFVLGRPISLYSGVVNYTRDVNRSLQARVEYRHDFAGGPAPFPGDRPGLFRDNQGTIILALLATY
jgi:hypothetical protein